MTGAEPERPNELSPITRIDTARARPVQSAAGRSIIEPGSPWQNPFVESFGSRVRDEVLSVEAFAPVLEAQTDRDLSVPGTRCRPVKRAPSPRMVVIAAVVPTTGGSARRIAAARLRRRDLDCCYPFMGPECHRWGSR